MTDSEVPRKNPILKIFKVLLGFVKGYFMMIGFLVTLLPIGLAMVIAKHGGTSSTSNVVDKAVVNGKPGIVTVQMEGELLERSPDFSAVIMQQFFGDPTGIYLPDFRRSLRAIAKNDQVKGLHLDLSMLDGGAAELSELRQILIEFKASGKPIHIFVADLDNAALQVASVADRITLSPAGSVMLPGPMFQLVYFGEGLRKLGISVEVIRHGKYKSAFEPFVLNDPSAESLEMYRSMEGDLRGGLIERVATGRKKSKEEVTNWFARSFFTGKEALELGVVDELAYLAESRLALEKATGGTGQVDIGDLDDQGQMVQGDLFSEKASKGGAEMSGSGGIALIEAIGEISMADMGGRDGEGITPESLIAELKWAAEDPEVKSVVMRVSSPGGSAVASDIIWREVKRLAETKPVVVSMGNVAASGGYYISAPAARIFAESSSITGSIGVIGMLPKFTEFRQKYGVSFHTVTQSQREKLLGMGSASTDEDKKLFSMTIDNMYQEFIAKVAEGRSLKVEDVDRMGQGRVYTGTQALELGLVDELGGIQDAFQAAKKLAGLDESKLYPVLRYEPEQLSLAQCLRSPKEFSRCLQQGSRAGISAAVNRAAPKKKGMQTIEGVQRIERRLNSVARLIENESVLALWPGVTPR